MTILGGNFEGRFFVKKKLTYVIKHMGEAKPDTVLGTSQYFRLSSAVGITQPFAPILKNVVEMLIFKLFSLIINILDKCISFTSNIAMGTTDPRGKCSHQINCFRFVTTSGKICASWCKFFQKTMSFLLKLV